MPQMSEGLSGMRACIGDTVARDCFLCALGMTTVSNRNVGQETTYLEKRLTTDGAMHNNSENQAIFNIQIKWR